MDKGQEEAGLERNVNTAPFLMESALYGGVRCVAKIKPGPKISVQTACFFQERKFFFAGTFMPPARSR
jgi:hypothetical protein